MERLGELTATDFLGVDVLVDQDGQPFVCDVNPVCGFRESVRVTGIDVAAEVIRYVRDTSRRAGELVYSSP